MQNILPQVDHDAASDSTPMICAKCGNARLSFTDRGESREFACAICGWTAYEDLPRPVRVFAVRVRYAGLYPEMRGRVVDVAYRKRSGFGATKLLEIPSCPFCGKDMTQQSMSGKRKNWSERRFRCASQHFISLFGRRGGAGAKREALFWK